MAWRIESMAMLEGIKALLGPDARHVRTSRAHGREIGLAHAGQRAACSAFVIVHGGALQACASVMLTKGAIGEPRAH